MFSNNTFVRVKRRNSQQVLFQFTFLIVLVFVCIVGVLAFMHVAGPSGAGAMASNSAMQEGLVEIVVPIENIEPGATLDPAMFRRERRPEVTVGPEIVRDFEEVKGLYSRGLLVANQPIHRDFLTTLQPVNALTASIPTGYRAIAIPVDATSSVEGWAQPGARVDLVWVTHMTGQNTVSIIASNAKVLSANRRTESADNDDPRAKEQGEQIPHTVTLLLANRDSLRVRLASLNGKLSLILRGQDAGTSPNIGTFTQHDLGNSGNLNAPAPARNLVTVQVKDRKSGKVQEMTFENGQRVAE